MKCSTPTCSGRAASSLFALCLALPAFAPRAYAGPLLDLAQAARSTNPGVAAALHRAAAKAEGVKIARAARKPQVTMARSLPLRRTDHASVTTRWADPTTFTGHRLARLQSSAAGAAVVQAQQDLTADLALAVVEQARLRALLRLQHDRVAQLDKEFDHSQAQFNAGLSAITDVYQVEAQRMGARAKAAVLARQQDDAGEALRQLAGMTPATPLRLRDELRLPVIAGDAAAWTAQARQANPRLRQRKNANIVAQRDMQLAEAALLPSLTSRTMKPSRASKSKLSRTHPITRHTLAMPITSAVSPGSAVRKASHGVAAAMATYRIDDNALARETRRLHRQLATAPTRLEAALSSVAAAAVAEAATVAGHELGLRSLIDVLRARQRSWDAQVRAMHARHDAVADWIRARHVLGAANDDALAQLEPMFDVAPVANQGDGATVGASTSTSATVAAAFDEKTMR